MWRRPAPEASDSQVAQLDVARIRGHFDFPVVRRIVTNNAASTKPPRELLEFYRSLCLGTAAGRVAVTPARFQPRGPGPDERCTRVERLRR